MVSSPALPIALVDVFRLYISMSSRGVYELYIFLPVKHETQKCAE